MTRITSWFLVVLLLGVFGVVVVRALGLRADAGKSMPAYSVYSTERDGLRECGRLLHKLGWEPVAVTRPVQGHRQRGLLILVEPLITSGPMGEAADLPENEVQGLLNWVERGNTLLLCGRTMTDLHRALDISIRNDTEVSRETTQRVGPAEAGGYTEDIDALMIEGRDTLRAPSGLPLWWLDNGQVGAVLLKRGKGRVLVVADPSLLTRRGLARADNAMFLYNVATLHARDGRVYFDEYHHGLRSSSDFLGYLRHHDQQWAILPVLFVVLVAIWGVAVRLGPAVPTPHTSQTDAVDYASGLARIYQRSGARRLLARTLVRDFLTVLTRHLHLRRNALPAEVLAAWRQRNSVESTQRLQGLLRGIAELRTGNVSDRGLLMWARAFDQFRAEVLLAR